MSLVPSEKVKGLMEQQRGFTLVEVVVTLWIVMVIGSILVGSVRQMNVITSRGFEQLALEADSRTLTQWLAGDLQMAKTTNLADGAPPYSCALISPDPCIILQWTDEFGGSSISHAVSYALAGTQFERTYDGATHTVARNVTQVEVSLAGALVTVTLTSTSNKWPDISRQSTQFFHLGPS